jgi:hypothetical protein
MQSREAKRQQAAKLVAIGKLTLDDIAKAIGCSPRTIDTWKADPAFVAEVASIKNSWRGRANSGGLADLDFTLRNLQDRHTRLRAIIDYRAKDPELRLAPGGKTGLICVTYKMQSKGEGLGSASVPEYAIDVAMLQEMREIEVQIQTHLGTWKQKVEVNHTVDITDLMQRLNHGRELVAQEKARRQLAQSSIPHVDSFKTDSPNP